uniref:Uncharacterized protein n=1 Tax=Micrurus lemniscatus lemniscatus TaxID=129467 RepID=A0A2D4JA34_MICLE
MSLTNVNLLQKRIFTSFKKRYTLLDNSSLYSTKLKQCNAVLIRLRQAWCIFRKTCWRRSATLNTFKQGHFSEDSSDEKEDSSFNRASNVRRQRPLRQGRKPFQKPRGRFGHSGSFVLFLPKNSTQSRYEFIHLNLNSQLSISLPSSIYRACFHFVLVFILSFI